MIPISKTGQVVRNRNKIGSRKPDVSLVGAPTRLEYKCSINAVDNSSQLQQNLTELPDFSIRLLFGQNELYTSVFSIVSSDLMVLRVCTYVCIL